VSEPPIPDEVHLRAVIDADLPILFAHQDDPDAAAMAAFPSREPEAFFEHWAKARANPDGVSRTILVGDVVVGHIVSWSEGGQRLVGYWIGRAYWGRGYATAALHLLLEDDTERPMFAHVALANIGSRRVLEHCGFTAVEEATADDGIREAILRLD
jgi:RimJ/RimL family protein N-acetyltransferase